MQSAVETKMAIGTFTQRTISITHEQITTKMCFPLHYTDCNTLVWYHGKIYSPHFFFLTEGLAGTLGLKKKMPSKEHSFYLLNTRTICALFLYN